MGLKLKWLLNFKNGLERTWHLKHFMFTRSKQKDMKHKIIVYIIAHRNAVVTLNTLPGTESSRTETP